MINIELNFKNNLGEPFLLIIKEDRIQFWCSSYCKGKFENSLVKWNKSPSEKDLKDFNKIMKNIIFI